MSTSAIPVHVALVDDSGQLDASTLAEVAGALNEQVTADFVPAWHVRATVGAYPTAPPHTWAIHLQEGLDQPGALGYHTDTNNQPVSFVDISGGSGHGIAPDWTVTASHELLEMLADPFGNRLHGARHLDGFELAHGRMRYLLEVCDPCEATSYEVGGVAVSDFILPHYYRSSRAVQKVSYANGVTEELEVAEGGYISFVGQDGTWYQRFVQGGSNDDRSLGKFDSKSGSSLREWVDAAVREARLSKS